MEEIAPQCTDAVGDDFTGVATDRHFTRLQQFILDATAAGAEAGVAIPTHGTRTRWPTQAAVDGVTRLLQRRARHAARFIWPSAPAGRGRSAPRRDCVHERPSASARSLSFSDSGAQQQQVLQSTLARDVSVNETLTHIAQDGLPNGRVGPSGMGTITASSASTPYQNSSPCSVSRASTGWDCFRRLMARFSRG